jgi:acetylornithine deacetylase/succinyl-diaminopimelate desuccinylase-like protein
MPSTPRLADYAASERDRIVDELLEYLTIPSISSDPAHEADVRLSAEFTAGLMRRAGLENVAVLDTEGAPAVYGDWLHAGPAAPTALVYGHHDVQPVDPIEEWTRPPFDPVIEDGECRARGSIDDKGQVLYELEAVRGLLSTEDALPINVKFLVEGEEEVGSPHIEQLLQSEGERFRTDLVVVSDTGMWSRDVPSMCVGMRGLLAVGLKLRTAPTDLHSGSFGGAAPNPAHILAGLLAGLHDADGRVTLPGFYDRVRQPTRAELDSLHALPFDEGGWMRTAGLTAVAGEADRSVLEKTWTRPSCDVVGIRAGHLGPGIRTVVPAQASATITFRLVADQRPEDVMGGFEDWLGSRLDPGAEASVEHLGAVAPALTPVDHPAVGALKRAIETVWGIEPLLTREGGSGPEESLARVLDAPLLFLGVGLPDDRIHAPNERMVMAQFWKGLQAAGELWHELAATAGVRRGNEAGR